MTRQIVLDTETTGLSPSDGHRIIEIGCIELLNRRITGNNFHVYLNPERQIDMGAIRVHGISNEFLQDKPRFIEKMDEFIHYIRGAELIIHNATFDVGFINHEFKLTGSQNHTVEKISAIFDTLTYARRLHPGQKNSLDALCKRYNVNNSNRQLHGALLDAELLAQVYLAMTGGQVTMFGDVTDAIQNVVDSGPITRSDRKYSLPVVVATAEELEAHQHFMENIQS